VGANEWKEAKIRKGQQGAHVFKNRRNAEFNAFAKMPLSQHDNDMGNQTAAGLLRVTYHIIQYN